MDILVWHAQLKVRIDFLHVDQVVFVSRGWVSRGEEGGKLEWGGEGLGEVGDVREEGGEALCVASAPGQRVALASS